MRHQFTDAQRKLGGQRRQQRPDAQQHQEYAYYMLQLRKPGVAMWIYQTRVRPHMQRKQTSREAVERSAMQQTVLGQHIGKRKPMH